MSRTYSISIASSADGTSRLTHGSSRSAASVRSSSPSSASADVLPPAAGRPGTRGRTLARLKQLLRMQAFEPALRVEGSWENAVDEVCRHWLSHIERQGRSDIDVVALERLVALEAERRSLLPDSLQARFSRKLRPASNGVAATQHRTREAIHEEELSVFFDVLRLDSAERSRILEGFKTMGTGALHRALPTLLLSVAVGLAGAGFLADGAAAKSALGIARMIVQCALGGALFYSGWDRLRTSALEDVLTLGRVDAPPRLKAAPHLLRGAYDAIRHLPDMQDAVAALEQALEGVQDADEERRRESVREVRRGFARLCHLLSVADRYKRAADNATGEFKGNQRTLTASWGTSLMHLAGIGLSILSPMAIDAAAAGGVLTASALVGLLAYLAAQVAGGADADGLDKGRRAIANLVKHLAAGLHHESDFDRRAGAYANYLHECGGRPAVIGREARQASALRRLDQALENLAEVSCPQTSQGSSDAPAPTQVASSASSYVTALEEPPASVADSASQAGASGAEHEAGGGWQQAAADLLHRSWKTPVALRLEASERLVAGAVARTQAQLLDPPLHRKLSTLVGRTADRKREEALRARLAGELSDLYHFERARRDLVQPQPDTDGAAAHLKKIGNPHVRCLFTGDVRQQARAMKKAQKLTAGEETRYVMTNFGSIAVPVALTAGLGAGDLAVTLQRAAGTYSGPQYLDYKLGAVANTGVQPAAYASAAARASFKMRDMDAVRQALKPDVAMLLHVEVPEAAEQTTAERRAAWLPALPGELRQQRRVADVLVFQVPGQDDIEVGLDGTAGHLASLYGSASRSLRWQVKKAYMKMGMRHVGVGSISLLVQPCAARSMAASRGTRRDVPLLLERARQAMSQAQAGSGAAPAQVPSASGTDTPL